MSTWISSLVLTLLLGGCVAGGAGSPSGSSSASILGGSIVVAAPRGYCIDTAASQTAGESAVMFIGRCSDSADVPAAAITATIGETGSASVMAAGTDGLARYFASAEGRAALSRDGRAETVAVQEVLAGEGVVILHLNDAAIGEYWRAVLGIRGRLVTLAVTPPEGRPLTVPEGKLLLDRTIIALQRANASA